MTKNGSLKNCFTCGEVYDSANLGTLGCRFHCQGYNLNFNGQWFPKEHWECCGVSKDPFDKIHFDNRVTQKGCARIDHTGSLEEFERIINHPVELVEGNDPRSTYANDNWKKISNTTDLLNTVIPIGQPHGKAKYYRISVLYDNWKRDLFNPFGDQNDISYAYYVYPKLDVERPNDYVEPFYAVKRADFGRDPYIKVYLNTDAKCHGYEK